MDTKNKVWTKVDIEFLINNYPILGKSETAKQLNRSEASIRAKTSELKLKLDRNSEFYIEFQKRAALGKVGKKRPEHSKRIKELFENGVYSNFTNPSEDKRKIMSIRQKKWIKENGHPKGFLGKKRTDEEKKNISICFKKMWEDKNHIVNSDLHRQKIGDRMAKYSYTMAGDKMYSRAKRGYANIGGKNYYYRSSWEPNIACYFEMLKQNGDIKDWFYEVDTFWFENIKRGVRSYKPDFKIINNDDSFYYEEVKGWMDDKSKTKLNRMRIYYPNIDIRVLDSKRYNAIMKNKGIIKGWGEYLKEQTENDIISNKF